MLVGLQGSGKTTMAAKLAVHLRGRGQVPLLVAADVYRPAAIAQLETLAKQINVPVHTEPNHVAPPAICENAVKRARREGQTVVILDTAGRLQIDDQMMAELEEIRRVTTPNEILLIADAMTGQEAVSWLRVPPGAGDGPHPHQGGRRCSRGAALSSVQSPACPSFMGEAKTVGLEVFYPDLIRIPAGDVLTLIERAEASFSEEAQGRAQDAHRLLHARGLISNPGGEAHGPAEHLLA